MTNFRALVGTAVGILAIWLFFRFTSVGTQVLWNLSRGGTWLLPLVTVSALIDSINPCAVSILLITIAFLFSLGRKRGEILKIGGVYIAGIFLVYLLIGLGILQVLHLFNTPHFMAKIGAAALIGWGGINLINKFMPTFPIKLRIPSIAHGKLAGLMHRATLPAALGLGVLVGLCEFPCTGGPYMMVLGLLHDRSSYVNGLGYLILYNLVFIAPLGVVLGLASVPQLHEQVKTWRRQNASRWEVIGNIILVSMGLLILML